jgi:hypothetical protein
MKKISTAVCGLALAAPLMLACAPAASADGMYLVPSEFGYGTYRATPTGSSVGGYVEVCATIACDIGSGMIDNHYFRGPEYVVVTSQAVAIKIERATLTKVGS